MSQVSIFCPNTCVCSCSHYPLAVPTKRLCPFCPPTFIAKNSRSSFPVPVLCQPIPVTCTVPTSTRKQGDPCAHTCPNTSLCPPLCQRRSVPTPVPTLPCAQPCALYYRSNQFQVILCFILITVGGPRPVTTAAPPRTSPASRIAASLWSVRWHSSTQNEEIWPFIARRSRTR